MKWNKGDRREQWKKLKLWSFEEEKDMKMFQIKGEIQRQIYWGRLTGLIERRLGIGKRRGQFNIGTWGEGRENKEGFLLRSCIEFRKAVLRALVVGQTHHNVVKCFYWRLFSWFILLCSIRPLNCDRKIAVGSEGFEPASFRTQIPHVNYSATPCGWSHFVRR